MDQTRENGQKLLIAAFVLIIIFTIITILISEDERIGFTAAVSTVAVALEIIMHIPLLSKDKNVPCVAVSSKVELGNKGMIFHLFKT